MSEDFARADESLVGRVIGGKFKLRSCIGVGASGAVYLADQLALGRTVAVKILRPDLAVDARFVRRFEDEATAASRLNHPNTVSIIDYGQSDDGLLFLVMEYLRGRTMAELCEAGPLEAPRIADLLMQVLAGLEEAHEAGVVHADLKTDNIVVESRRGGWELAKVVDFGIARLVGARDEEGESERTICGTPEYMAPEVIEGQEPTYASDIYAVGGILYELMVGRTPFAGTDIMQVLTRHLDEAPVPPSEAAPDRAIDPRLERIALQALEKRADDRFPSAARFREALADIASAAREGGEETLCTACGAFSQSTFRFCPECGEPRTELAAGSGPTRTPEENEEVPALPFPTGKEPTVAFIASPRPTRELASAERPTRGLFPLPFAGRESELEFLLRYLTGRGDRRLLHVAGPGGSGKSRLLEEAFRRLEGEEVAVYVTSPDPSGLASPLYPVRALVAGVLELPPVCTYQHLSSQLLRAGLTERDLPGIAELFGHPAEIAQLEAHVRRRELLSSTVRVLRAAAAGRATVLVFEDLHRYDSPSRAIFQRLCEEAAQHALRLIATTDERTELELPSSAAPVRLGLGGLEASAVFALAAHLRGKGSDMPEGDRLLELTGGVPGHVHQLARYVVEGGGVEEAPPGLADLVSARLELLARPARLTCQAAAVFGLEVARPALRKALGGELERDEIDQTLAVITARGILEEEEGALRFAERVVRDVAYDATPADVRRGLHASAADALEEITSEPGLLGHHRELAGALGDAAGLLARAGDAAVRQLDDHGACLLYNRSLACSRRLMLTEDEEARRGPFVTTSVKLADALRATGQVSLARGLVEEATLYCQGGPSLMAHLRRAHARVRSAEGAREEALAEFREALALAIMTGQRDLLAELYLDLANLLLDLGRKEEALGELAEGIDLVTAGEGGATEDGPETLWRLLLKQATLCAALGRREDAVRLATQATAHARRASARAGLARAHALIADNLEALGRAGPAGRHRDLAVMEFRRLGDRRGTAELLLAGSRLTRTVQRIHPSTVAEAKILAEEVGWEEGVRQAEQAADRISVD